MSQRNPQNERYTVEREGRAPGSTRPSAGSARPASKAGASVRMEPTKTKMTKRQKVMAETTMSKEEKKARRAKERELENLIYTATTVLTNKDEKYKKLRRIWWGMLIAAVVFTGLSWATLATNVGGAVLSTVVLVLAYAGIIGALIMDFTVIRKRRNVFRDRVNAMTKKQVERIVEESYTERTATDAAKKAKKDAKKAHKDAAEQEAAYQAAYNEVMAAGKSKRAAEDAADAQASGKGARGKGAKAGSTKVSVVSDTQGEQGDSAADASTGVDAEAAAAEEARKAAALKVAREFAASKGRL